MESGVVSLVIIKLPYCLCGELVVVSVELVTASEALVLPNVLFSNTDQKWFCLQQSVSFLYVLLLKISYFAVKNDLNDNFLWI